MKFITLVGCRISRVYKTTERDKKTDSTARQTRIVLPRLCHEFHSDSSILLCLLHQLHNGFIVETSWFFQVHLVLFVKFHDTFPWQFNQEVPRKLRTSFTSYVYQVSRDLSTKFNVVCLSNFSDFTENFTLSLIAIKKFCQYNAYYFEQALEYLFFDGHRVILTERHKNHRLPSLFYSQNSLMKGDAMLTGL